MTVKESQLCCINYIQPFIFILLVFITSTQFVNAQTCCQVSRGNIDGDPSDIIDISDIVYYVDYSFNGGPTPPCFEEADVDNSGTLDISDIVLMVNYSFAGGPAPEDCSESNIMFFDDFLGSSGQLPNALHWDYDIGTNWGNNQLEYDTDRPSNVSLDGNGNLAIIAREESYMGQPYTSARIVSRDLFEFTYGKVEARIKLPYGQGIWPAFWLLGANIETIGWPSCGEIDIMEYLGNETNKVHGTVHGPGYSGGGGIGNSYVLPSGGFDEDFHVFAIEWSENEIRWYVDNIQYFSIIPDDLGGNDWVFDHPFYIILNVAVGGNWPGSPDGTTVFPQTMLIDYVKVYADTGIVTVPTVSAPTPVVDPADVISLFSNVYTDEPVDTWSAVWDDADVSDYTIGTDSIKRYDNLVYAGVECVTQTIDLTQMTHFHIDVWTPEPTSAPAEFKVKLVDFGANGVWDGGGDDVEHEITFDESTMSTRNWVSLDIPLTDFAGLTTKQHFAQLVIAGDLSTIFIDNIYFYNSGIDTEPTVPAPTPTVNASNVISLFSDVYTNEPVDTWSAFWDVAEVSDFNIGPDNIKKYTDLFYAGIEFTTSTIDVSNMTHFHMDVWTPDPTDAPAVFNIKLVDFGPNGVWDGGGDDVEHEISLDETIMNSSEWVSIEIEMSEFVNLVTREHLAQMVIGGDPNTVFIDNIYFYNTAPTSEPSIPAPTPTLNASDVISIFSDTYSNVTVDSWSAVWDAADVEDFSVTGNNTKKYTNLVFAGIEFTSSTIDATTMTHFHIDVWTPDQTSDPSVFKIKLVDFGANGVFGGGDDVEHEVTFTESTMNTGSWVSIDIPLSDFTSLITQGHLAQLLLSGDPNTVFVDNIYLHK